MEVPLLATLAVSEASLKGYTDPEVERACSRAYDLCRGSEDRPEIFPVLTGLGAYSFMRPNLDHALELAERLLRMAGLSSLPEPRIWAQFVAGSVKSHTGDLTAALRHEESCILKYDPARHVEFLLQFGLDPGIAAYAQGGRIAWIFGFPDRAQKLVDEALAASGKHPHEYTRAFVLYFATIVACYRGDAARCLDLSEQLYCVALENAFPMFLGWGGAVHGWADAETGNTEAGIERIRQGLAQNQKIGTGLMRPEHLGLLASVLVRCGKMDEALSALDEAIATSESTKEIFCLPELLRLKAAYILRRSRASSPDAEALLRKSIRVAREMHAGSFELRPAVSLGRLLEKEERKEEGRELVSSVYEKFTEGFDTPDLVDASRFLSSWPQKSVKNR